MLNVLFLIIPNEYSTYEHCNGPRPVLCMSVLLFLA